jgi:hypothetical protein
MLDYEHGFAADDREAAGWGSGAIGRLIAHYLEVSTSVGASARIEA